MGNDHSKHTLKKIIPSVFMKENRKKRRLKTSQHSYVTNDMDYPHSDDESYAIIYVVDFDALDEDVEQIDTIHDLYQEAAWCIRKDRRPVKYIGRPLPPVPLSQQTERTQQPTRDTRKEPTSNNLDERYETESDDNQTKDDTENDNTENSFQKNRHPVISIGKRHIAPPIGRPLPPLPLSQQTERTQQPTRDTRKEFTSDDLDEIYGTDLEWYEIYENEPYETYNPEENNNTQDVYENIDSYFQKDRRPVTCIGRPLPPLPLSQQTERTQQPTRDPKKEFTSDDLDEIYRIELEWYEISENEPYETYNPEENNNTDHVYDNIDSYFQRDRRPVTCIGTRHLAPPIRRPLPPLPLSQQAERTQQLTRDTRKKLTSDDLDERYETESDDNQTKDDTENDNTENSFQAFEVFLQPISSTTNSNHQNETKDNTSRNIPAVALSSEQHPIAIKGGQPFTHLNTLPPSNESILNYTDQQNVEMANDEDMCKEYMRNLSHERETIIQNIKVNDIVPLLLFLGNQDNIYAVARFSEKDAVRMILGEMERSKEIENWRTFIDALEQCGYSFVVDTIRGYKFINYGNQKDHLKKVTPIISKMINPPVLMPYLMCYDLITDTDKEKIICECNNNGAIAGALLLLERIPKKHNDWYMSFIEVLEKAEYKQAAQYLKKEHLMENGRVKEHDGYFCIRHACSGENVYTKIDGKQLRTKSNHSNLQLIQLEKERNELRQEKSELNLMAEIFKRKYSDIERKIAQLDIQIENKGGEIAAFTEALMIRGESEDDEYEEPDCL